VVEPLIPFHVMTLYLVVCFIFLYFFFQTSKALFSDSSSESVDDENRDPEGESSKKPR
jgi:hypothetical protein